MRFSSLVERIGGEGADAWDVHNQARRALESGGDVILLSVGDPDIDTPEPVLERAIESLRAGDTHYTAAAGRMKLRAAIAAQHVARCGQDVDADNVIFLAGAQNALFAASLCLAGPGDEVIAFDPLYPTYPATLQAAGARMVRVPAHAAAAWRIDLAALEGSITARTRAIFFATPNNPSGRVLSDEELSVIGDLARKHSLWVVADEVYAGLAPEGRVPSLAARLPDQVVTISSLSKSHSMSGWRAGWMVGPTSLIRHAESLSLCMLYGLPGFVQEAALTALAVAAAAEARIRDFCAARLEVLLDGLQNIDGTHVHVPDAGMFALLDVSGTGLTGHAFMTDLYRKEGVSVIDGGAFGRATSGCVRICFAADETAVAEACRRIRRFVGST
jgi:aspartate/methionine/tyrosine aminotransferase